MPSISFGKLVKSNNIYKIFHFQLLLLLGIALLTTVTYQFVLIVVDAETVSEIILIFLLLLLIYRDLAECHYSNKHHEKKWSSSIKRFCHGKKENTITLTRYIMRL